jgi:sigma-B regulation protein RsbU (phosphoserine phosphatase)
MEALMEALMEGQQERQQARQQARQQERQRTSSRLLLVESRSDEGEALAQTLEQLGYAVLRAASGQRTLELLAAQHPDLILLSTAMPEMREGQLLRRLHGADPSRHVPVVALVPSDADDLAVQCLEWGADDYVHEHAPEAVLRARLAVVLSSQSLFQRQKQLLRYERDLQIGHQIQLGFLPQTLPQPPGLEIAAAFRPAREVAGDFYDAFTLSNNRRVGFVIADVCDKGVGPALFMAIIRSLIRAFAQQHYSLRWMDNALDLLTMQPTGKPRADRRRSLPSIGTAALKDAVELTNNYIVRNHSEAATFATLFFGVLDPETGALGYVNAGHDPPVIVGQGGVKERLTRTGPAVGLFPDADYEIRQSRLDPGDVLLAFTDGVTDARDPGGAFFGEARLLALAQQPCPSAEAMLSRITGSVVAHIASANQFDDITMSAVRRAGPSDPDQAAGRAGAVTVGD